MSRMLIASAALATALTSAAAAETELSFYSGLQTSPHSRITGTIATGTSAGPIDKLIGWQGRSMDMPPYYGARVTFWNDRNSGWGFEFTHDKAYAGNDMLPEFSRLEFTDGHNIITVNYSKRWPNKWANFTPYVSGGVGFALPHVDITPTGGTKTFGYQLTGPAARLTAGASYKLTERWSLFSEYQFTISENDVSLTGGGSLNTRIITNALNVGVSMGF